jgi:CheY-like chemotaxis protein
MQYSSNNARTAVESKRCEVIAVTAYNNEDNISECFKVGMKQVL